VKVRNGRYLRSATKPSEVPSLQVPRVAFVGRSNVGKSSLLNQLAGIRGLARVSRTPGRTRQVNYFLVDERLAFIDLPGYGYSRAPASLREDWGPLSEAALLMHGGTDLVILLVDGRRPPTELDRQMAEWLTSKGLAWIPVLTKMDKLRASERRMAADALAAMAADHPGIATSARTGEGIAHLWKEIESVGRRDSKKPPRPPLEARRVRGPRVHRETDRE